MGISEKAFGRQSQKNALLKAQHRPEAWRNSEKNSDLRVALDVEYNLTFPLRGLELEQELFLFSRMNGLRALG